MSKPDFQRTEYDFLGSRQIPGEALFGLQSLRAAENFPYSDRFHEEWYRAMGWVKLACYQTIGKFFDAIDKKKFTKKVPIRIMNREKLTALEKAASEVAEGKHFSSFIVPATQGGAGTSINMNVNEIIVNRALQIIGLNPGDYTQLHPIEDANLYQSTNDVVPTALRMAMMALLRDAEDSINKLRAEIERLEVESRNMLRIGHTQMQEAVPSSYGRLFGAYSEALSRDWWRISKCFERIKTINLGGGAIGTATSVPRFFLMEASRQLQQITGLPATRSENLADSTMNLDPLVEVHAILKAHAVNLEKMASDLRLLASDFTFPNDISIPARQIGSTIMPGKVNPVIAEFVISAAHKVYANDQLITQLSAQGCLDLNAYIPSIGHAILESQKLLLAADKSITDNLLKGLTLNPEPALKRLFMSPAVTTALSPYIGYDKATIMARKMKTDHLDVFGANEELQFFDPEELKTLLKPDQLLRAGFTLSDLFNK
ncbi:MAG TPA: aspartate ammonia-lyase [Bacteroidales bacterium]|nr:MAG: aspartate ammonia-lyase [Bacteroidetes bacterium GWE2_42_24]OFY31526.1 MAG: aspartate ammonia-lyase [Bacteroidetes bacterium GWF2_43_11]HAQ65762.1 aspartate ammonia-lyase [Bacteroidales bacterium]HBZ67224.1 aspartate ammonia-lyase [Bacteroidales bacterium]